MATIGAILGSVLTGVLLGLLTGFKQHLLDQARPGGTRRLPLLFSLLGLFLVPAMLLSGAAVDRWGIRSVMLAGLLGLTFALLIFSSGPKGRQVFAALLLALLGGSAISIGSLVLAARVFLPGETVASVALACVFTALGAAGVPLLRGPLLHGVGQRRTFLILALLCLVPVLPLALSHSTVLDGPKPTAEQQGLSPQKVAEEQLPTLVEQELVWMAAGVFAFYAPLEAVMSLVARRTRRQGDVDLEDLGPLRAFWIALVASRLVLAVLQHFWILLPWWDGWLLTLSAFLVAVLLGNLAGAGEHDRSRWGGVLLGLCLGPIYPTLAGMVLRECPHEQGTALGVLFAAGALGSLLLSPAFRRRNDEERSKVRKEAYYMQVLPLVLAVGLVAAILVFVLASRT
jgi:MFS family permease